jgi:hypothetical protein
MNIYEYIIHSQVVSDSLFYPYNCIHHNGDGSLKDEDQLHAPNALPQQKPPSPLVDNPLHPRPLNMAAKMYVLDSGMNRTTVSPVYEAELVAHEYNIDIRYIY